MRKAVLVAWAAGSLLAGVGCGSHNTNTSAKAPAAAAPGGASGSCSAKSAAEPLARTGGGAGSTLALAKLGGKTVAFVADEDAKAILTVDVDTRTQLAETPLDAAPAQVLVARDGRVLATLRQKSELVVLAASRPEAPLSVSCSVPTAPEPIALATTPDERTVLVTSGWGRALAGYDAATLTQRYAVSLGREPRAVVVSEDGATAFVSHAVGSALSVVDLAGAQHAARAISMNGFDARSMALLEMQQKQIAMLMAKRAKTKGGAEPEDDAIAEVKKGKPSCQGFALAKSAAVPNRVLAPQVIVDPGQVEQRPDGYGDTSAPTEAPDIAVIDEAAKSVLQASVTRAPESKWLRIQRDARDGTPECLLPRAAVVEDKSKSLLVTCYGIDAVVAFDATSADPVGSERTRWSVGSGPSGIAIDPIARRAVVWSQFDRTISTFSVADMSLVDDKANPRKVAKSMLPPLREKMAPEVALGRILFHAAGDPRIAADGRACASCHPDGRDDGITWATPEGPRRSILLAGRVSQTAPYAWDGKGTTLYVHLGNTFDRLSGRGLRSIELDALVAYVSQLPAPPRAKPADEQKIARGKQIFSSREAGCSNCHAGATYTDGLSHDVQSKHKSDRGQAFNTPSLLSIGGTGPYFHDGRYQTLGELLKKSDGTMGHTSHLSAADMDALESFLRTL
jgi:DNA-binding beta-propeller fold protein YncE